MKKSKILGLLLILFAFSCTDSVNEVQKVDEDTKISSILDDTYYGDVLLPNGTSTKISNDGGKLEFFFPDGIIYAGRFNGKIITTSSGCYQCTSTCSKGCDVVRLGSSIGCSRCETALIDVTCTGSDCSNFANIEEAGFVDLKQGIKIANSDEIENLNLLTPPWSTLENILEVEKELDRFYNEYWGNLDPKKTPSIKVYINLFGSLATAYVPENINGRVERVSSTTCECSGGGSGCNYEEIKKGFIVVGEKCNNNGCGTCRMNF
jgi:hypothetical protein